MFLSLIVLSVSISQAANQGTQPIRVARSAKSLPQPPHIQKMLELHPASPVVSPSAFLLALGRKTSDLQISGQPSPFGTPPGTPKGTPKKSSSPVINQSPSKRLKLAARFADQKFQDPSQGSLSGTILGVLLELE